MDGGRFVAWVQGTASSLIDRRLILHALVGGPLGGLAVALTLPADAKRRRKKRNTKLKKNAFGCVDVGKACRGNSANCCSGICEGNKPKKGKKDKSVCVAHDEGDCQPDQNQCVDLEDNDCTTTGGDPGLCARTTGQASYCAIVFGGACFPCRTDVDCQTVCGPTAACVVCAESCPEDGGTGCATTERCSFPS